MKDDPFKGICIGDRVMLIENERVYTVKHRYHAPCASRQPMLGLDAEDWKLKGLLRTVCKVCDAVKLIDISKLKRGDSHGKNKRK